MTPTQRLDRAQRARELLDNKLLTETLDRMQNLAVTRWRTSGLMNTDEREAAYRMVRALDEFRQELNLYVTDADLARRDIQQQ